MRWLQGRTLSERSPCIPILNLPNSPTERLVYALMLSIHIHVMRGFSPRHENQDLFLALFLSTGRLLVCARYYRNTTVSSTVIP